jgi:cell wall-associated NlpC family hydrolase
MTKISGPALGSVFVGSVFLYAGIKGYSVPKALQSIVRGKAPPNEGAHPDYPIVQSAVQPSTGPTISGGAASLGSGNGAYLAADALQYQGHVYQFGGSPGRDGRAPWDCSSFMNWIVGHDGGLAIPFYGAGRYDGTAHGPPTGTWLLWGGVKGIKRADLQPGDLLVWQTHMGMYLGNGQMISALGPNGTPSTQVTTIAGGSPAGEVLFPKRLVAVANSPTAAQVQAVTGPKLSALAKLGL